MLDLFSRNKYGLIGLDVGAEGVRMLQLGRTRDKPFVAAAARWHFPESALGPEADPRTRQRLAAEGVREMLKSGVFHGRDVVSCLRTDEMEIKNIRMPDMPDQELAGAVMWECQERFGFEVSPDRIHCIKAGEVRQGSEARNEVILMAISEDGIRRHLEMLSEMRLRPVHIDVAPIALFRAYQRFLRREEDTSTVTVIVDIGLARTKVIVARGATILLIKTFDLAGRKFNENVARELNMSYSEAASLRRRTFSTASLPEQGGASPSVDTSDKGHQVEWSVFDAIREQVEALAREISLCLRYCSVTFRGLRPDKITLTGGEAYDPHLMRSLNEYLDCKCVVGQPLCGIDLSEADLGSDRRSKLTEWSVAAGLAFRDMDGKIRPEGASETKISCSERAAGPDSKSAAPRAVPAGSVAGPLHARSGQAGLESGLSDRKADYAHD